MCLFRVSHLRNGPVEAYKLFSLDREGRLAPAFVDRYEAFRYEMGVVHRHPDFWRHNHEYFEKYQDGFFACETKEDAQELISRESIWDIRRGCYFVVLPVVLSGSVWRGRFGRGNALVGETIWIPKTTLKPLLSLKRDRFVT